VKFITYLYLSATLPIGRTIIIAESHLPFRRQLLLSAASFTVCDSVIHDLRSRQLLPSAVSFALQASLAACGSVIFLRFRRLAGQPVCKSQ